LIEVILALLFVGSIYASMNGILAGTYILFTLIAIHISTVIFISSVMIGTSLAKSDSKKEKTAPETSARVKFLMQLFVAVAGYHLFTLGYMLIAGMLIVTIPIAFFSNLISVKVNAINTSK
jgi:hypothetical protein